MTTASPSDLIELAGAVVGRLAPGILIRVRKFSVEAEVPQGGEVDVEGQLSLQVGLDHERSVFACATTYDLTALRSDEDGDTEVMWSAQLEINGQWNVESVEGLTDDELRAFGIKVGMMTLHPYARAHLQNAVVTTGWPAYTLDVVTTPEALFASDDSGGVDLEGIGVSRVGVSE